MSKPPTIAFLYPGAMGSALAGVLHARNPSWRLLTAINGRSEATLARARAVGLETVDLPTVVGASDAIISILPPSAAVDLAADVSRILQANPRKVPPVYVDANAVSPETMARIAAVLGHNVPLIDASVIGLPPTDTKEPTVYLSSDPKWREQLQAVAGLLGGERGWKKVKVLPDAGAGGASALKMCYGGLNKGTIGLAALMVLSANAHSPGTARAFMDEMATSRPDLLSSLGFTLKDMQGKAYRWVGEMEEISSFVTSSLAAKDVGQLHLGLAAVFERVAADLRATGTAVGGAAEGEAGDAREIEALTRFADEGKAMLEERGYKK